MRKTWLLLTILLVSLRVAVAAQDEAIGSVLNELDGYLEWDPVLETGVILIAQDRVAFKPGFPMAVLNYQTRITIDPPVRRDGDIYFTQQAVSAIRDALVKANMPKEGPSFRVSTIVIDPGHGGADPGSVDEIDQDGKKVPIREKDITLSVASDLVELLKAGFADRKVVMTRTTDTTMELEDRTKLANSLLSETTDCVLFISVHANRNFNTKASGFEAWCLPPDYKRTLVDPNSTSKENQDILPILNSMQEEEVSVESIILAKDILKGLDDHVGQQTPDRGLKQEDWFVVRNSKMPAVLVEVGFISNPDEGKRLTDEAYLKDIAEGIYDGIRSFISTFEQGGSPGD